MKLFILIVSAMVFWLGAVFYIQKEDGQSLQKRKYFIYVLMFLCSTGVVTALYIIYPNNLLATNLRLLFLCTVLWPVAVRDYREHIIPNKLIMIGCLYWIFTVFLQLIIDSDHVFIQVKSSLIAAGGIFIVCMLCLLLMKNSIGMGDVKLFMMMGLLQGLNGLFAAVFYSLLVSFFVACYLLIRRKKGRKDVMCFGPSVLIGTTMSVVLGGM